MRRAWLGALVAAGLWVSCAVAQTPASQANDSQWKQTPEGRTPEPSTTPNCSSSTTWGSGGKATTTSNCPNAQDQPMPTNAGQQFPYPGEAPAANSATPNAAKAPNAAGEQQTPANPSKQFPYPGEPDAQPANPSNAAHGTDTKSGPPDDSGLKDAGSSGSSNDSSGTPAFSSSNASGNDPGDIPDDTPVKTRSSRRRVKPAEPVQTNTQRESEDLQVAGFYQNDGNFMGAYLRAKDAVTIATNDPDAHLALAEAARRLGKLDEAETNYKRCLSLDPMPKTRKAAQQALKEMTGGS